MPSCGGHRVEEARWSALLGVGDCEIVNQAANSSRIVDGRSRHEAADGETMQASVVFGGCQDEGLIVIQDGGEVSTLAVHGVGGWAPKPRLILRVRSAVCGGDAKQPVQILQIGPLDPQHGPSMSPDI